MALVTLMSSAAAQEYPPAADTLTVSDSTVVPGQTITIAGTGCDAGASVTHTFDSVGIATTTADAGGSHSAQGTIPSNAELGVHTISGSGSGCSASTTVTVVGAGAGAGAAAAQPVTGEIAFTGSSSVPAVWIALAALALGTALVVASRRRATTRAHIEGV